MRTITSIDLSTVKGLDEIINSLNTIDAEYTFQAAVSVDIYENSHWQGDPDSDEAPDLIYMPCVHVYVILTTVPGYGPVFLSPKTKFDLHFWELLDHESDPLKMVEIRGPLEPAKLIKDQTPIVLINIKIELSDFSANEDPFEYNENVGLETRWNSRLGDEVLDVSGRNTSTKIELLWPVTGWKKEMNISYQSPKNVMNALSQALDAIDIMNVGTLMLVKPSFYRTSSLYGAISNSIDTSRESIQSVLNPTIWNGSIGNPKPKDLFYSKNGNPLPSHISEWALAQGILDNDAMDGVIREMLPF